MPTTNTGRPLVRTSLEAGRTRTSEFFWRDTRAGCPSRIIACCCGFEARNATVSPVETQPPSAAQSATIPRLRMRYPQNPKESNRNYRGVRSIAAAPKSREVGQTTYSYGAVSVAPPTIATEARLRCGSRALIGSSPFVATALAQSRDRYSKSIGEARLMVGNANPDDGARAEAPRRLSLRCGHRAFGRCLRISRRRYRITRSTCTR